MSGVIHTVEMACSWPGCDAYASVSQASPKRLTARARRWAVTNGWSWRTVDGRTSARCPDHRGKRVP